MKKKRLFRFHKGLLDESMKTCVKVRNLRDIEQKVKDEFSCPPMKIESVEICDHSMDDSKRLGEEWEETFYVIAHIKDGKFVAGMCNFYEDKTSRDSTWKKYLWYAIFVLYLAFVVYFFLIFYICGIIGYIGEIIYEKYFDPIFERIIYNYRLWD